MGAKLTTGELMMINFMCQLDWDTGCPDIWPNIILAVSVRVSG